MCQAIRDKTAIIGGLVEYIAMSGQDVLPPGEALEGRKQLLEAAASATAAALSMTDAIIEHQVIKDNRRSKDSIAADIAERQEKIDKLDKVTNRDLIEGLQKEITLLQREQRLNTYDARNKELADNITSIVSAAAPGVRGRSGARIDLDQLHDMCKQYVSLMPEDGEDARRKSQEKSRTTIELAKTRAVRMRNVENAVKVEAKRIADSQQKSSFIALANAKTARDRYDDAVGSTMAKLINRSQGQIHRLRATDTIDSICRQYKIGENLKKGDITPGVSFTVALPERYSPQGLRVTRTYSVTDVGVGVKDPRVTLQYDASGSQDVPEFANVEVPASVIIAALSTKNEAASIDEARRKLGEELEFAASAVLRQIGSGLRGE
jgi:hypothetical protein